MRSSKLQDAVAFFGAAVADGEQAAEAAVGGAVGRVGEDVGRAVAEDEAGADVDREVQLFGLREGADDAGDRVAVGDADGGVAERVRLLHQLARMRAAAQEGEVRRRREFDVSHFILPRLRGRGTAA